MLNERENFFALMDGHPEYAPEYTSVYHVCAGICAAVDKPGKNTNGYDSYGCRWKAEAEGMIPAPGEYLFEDISEWKDKMTFMDVDTIDAGFFRDVELKNVDRSKKVINVMWGTGIFDRIIACMGFENALMAMVEDPDECYDFFGAVADHKIKTLKKIIEAYSPDVITYCDDYANARSLFMSPACYRELIKPHQKRILEAMKDSGVIVCQHTCGKCEDIVPDYVDMGVKIWNSAQHMNDLPAIQKTYGSKLIVEGGFNGSGPAAMIDAQMPEILEETQRCIDEYVPYKNFILFACLMNERGNGSAVGDPRYAPLDAYWYPRVQYA